MSNIFRHARVGLLTSLCLVSASFACSGAGAAAIELPTATVRYADLNLGTADGVRVLYQRLKTASRQVCRAYEGRELARVSAWRACYDEALTGAVTQLNIPNLTAAHGKPGLHATES
jgi:UrcA family protein